MPTFFRRHWFLLLLGVVLAVGLWCGPRLAEPVSVFPRGWIVAVVMFITAFPMAFSQLTTAARQVKSVGIALMLSTVAAPLLAWCFGRVLPPSLAAGLVVAAAVPCTLASAAVWTRRGGGNDSIALLVTLTTNIACFVVMPSWLWLFLRTQVPLNAAQLSLRLLWLVVVPIAAAQTLRFVPRVAAMATRWKQKLSIAAQLGVLLMVFFGAISAGNSIDKAGSGELEPGLWALFLCTVLGLHLALFGLGWWLSEKLHVHRANQLAVAVSGSQKTLMIGLDVSLSLAATGLGGLVVLPMVAYHVVQLLVDTLLVDWLRADGSP